MCAIHAELRRPTCAKTRCELSKTQCNDGSCVSMDKKCDGTNDCADGSDELNCADWKCPLDKMWRCSNGKCVFLNSRCDGQSQCSDGSDEENCSEWQCPANSWRCPSSSRCIRQEARCDGQDDCGNSEDEQGCGNWTCAPGMWKCVTNRCIYINKRCDGTNDCTDYSDEQDCKKWKCPLGYWRCGNKQCIPIESRCDGYKNGYIDCDDGSDELNCGCGDEQSGKSGAVQSPNFPASYSSNANCSWTIQCTRCKAVALTFTVFDVESDPTCGYDYVELLDGTGESTTSLGKFCGGRNPERITSESDTVTVNFVSDGSVVRNGFRLEYYDTGFEKCQPGYWQCKNKQCIPISGRCDGNDDCKGGEDEKNCGCGDRQLGSSGAIQSPNFPGNYDNNLNCSWIIGSYNGKPISVSFTSFEMELYSCSYDYVELFDGDCPDAPSLGKFCGSAIPTNFTPTADVIRVNFITDTVYSMRGFRLEFYK